MALDHEQTPNLAEVPPTIAHPRAAALRPFDNAYLVLALASLFWSGNHIIGRAIAGHVPPFGLSTVRWVIPCLILWPFVRTHLRREWPTIKRSWRILLLLGMLGGALFSALQYIGLQYTTALNVSVLNSLGPALIAVSGAVIFGDRLTGTQMLGIAVSMAGVVVIVTRGDAQVLATLAFNWGDLIVLFNMILWGIYAVCLRLKPDIHWMTFMLILAVISAVGTTPLWIWEHASGYTFQPTLMTLIAILYVGTLPSLAAYSLWNRGAELIGANRSGVFLHLIPLYTTILGGLFLGESLMAYHVLAFALILAGVWLTGRKQTG